MSFKVIAISLLTLILLSCANNQYLRSYKLNTNYKTLPNETMLEFRYAEVRKYHSQIPHVLKLIHKKRIEFVEKGEKSFSLRNVILFKEGDFVNEQREIKFDFDKLPFVFFYQGFKIKVMSVKSGIRYTILEEPEFMNEKSFFYGMSKPGEATSKSSTKSEGLAF